MSLPSPSSFWRRSLPFLLLTFLGLLLYGNTLHAPFYLDDLGAIDNNQSVKDLALALSSLMSKRGLSTFTFALNYHYDGLNVVGYHIVNISIHIGCGFLVFLLLKRIFLDKPWLALLGALLFVAHPLQTQGVTYLVQRMTSLSAFFFLLAVYLFVLARERLVAGAAFTSLPHLGFYLAAVLSGSLAILAKENAVVLPGALLLFARFFLPPAGGGWRPLLLYVAPFCLAPALSVFCYLLLPLLLGSELNTMGYSRLLRSMEGNSPLHYLATQCSVLWVYIRMLFLPYNQALDHGYPISRELLTLKSVTGGFGLIGLAAFAGWLRTRNPVVSFSIFWFFLTIAVESSVIPLDPLFEHRLYLPMFGFAVLLPCLAAGLWRRRGQMVFLLCVILLFSVLTLKRNALWGDPVAFYMDNLRVAPDNERVYFNAGQELLKVGIVDEGERLVRESIFLNPVRRMGYQSLKELYLAQNRLDEAIGMLYYGIDHVDDKDKGILYNDLAFVFGKKGDYEMAIEILRQAINLAPEIPTPYFNLAQMLMFSGDWMEVELNLRKTLELDPAHADALSMLEELYRGNLPGMPQRP